MQTFDVTALVQSGANELSAVVADGWYRGNLGFAGNRDVYGDRTGLLAQLEVDLADGSRQVIATDESWEAAQQIWQWAEPGYQEKKSSALLAEMLEKSGFEVKRGVAAIPTAFRLRTCAATSKSSFMFWRSATTFCCG